MAGGRTITNTWEERAPRAKPDTDLPRPLGNGIRDYAITPTSVDTKSSRVVNLLPDRMLERLRRT